MSVHHLDDAVAAAREMEVVRDQQETGAAGPSDLAHQFEHAVGVAKAAAPARTLAIARATKIRMP
jgi:hypothetical protein